MIKVKIIGTDIEYHLKDISEIDVNINPDFALIITGGKIINAPKSRVLVEADIKKEENNA